jgi:hypothetical protein
MIDSLKTRKNSAECTAKRNNQTERIAKRKDCRNDKIEQTQW